MVILQKFLSFALLLIITSMKNLNIDHQFGSTDEETIKFLIDTYKLNYIPGQNHIAPSYDSEDFSSNLPERYSRSNSRRYSASIWALYTGSDRVMWHTLKGDETWNYYLGNTMIIYIIDPLTGELTTKKVGNKLIDPEADFQVTVKNGLLFGAKIVGEKGFCFTSAQVTPAWAQGDEVFYPKTDVENLYPHVKDLL
jgi:predicted cupin superfamily sugar epimerase